MFVLLDSMIYIHNYIYLKKYFNRLCKLFYMRVSVSQLYIADIYCSWHALSEYLHYVIVLLKVILTGNTKSFVASALIGLTPQIIFLQSTFYPNPAWLSRMQLLWFTAQWVPSALQQAWNQRSLCSFVITMWHFLTFSVNKTGAPDSP